MGDFVALGCRRETLIALAEGLTLFGPADGEPEWLVSGVWLSTHDAQFLATASAEVLADGHVARPLNIALPEQVMQDLATDLPDLSAHLRGRGSGIELPEANEPLSPPDALKRWRADPYSTLVLVRVSKHVSTVNRVACALLFTGEAGGSLLVRTDVSSLAMVLSEDSALIARYRAGCEALTPKDYLSLGGT